MKDLLRYTFFVIMLISLAFLVSGPVLDWDFWWHLKTGQWIIEHKSVPSQDPFAFTSGGSPSDREKTALQGYWLSQIIMYAVWSTAGPWGIIVLRIVIFVMIAGFLSYWLSRIRPSFSTQSMLMMTFVIISFGFTGDRPQLFTFLFFPVVHFLLEKMRNSQPIARIRKTDLVLPFVMLIWSNMHGGFIAGIGLILFYFCDSLMTRTMNRYRVSVYISSILCSLVNPNGYIQLIAVVKALQEGYQHGILEHLNVLTFLGIFDFEAFGYIAIPYIAIVILTLGTLLLQWRTIKAIHWALLCTGMIMSFVSFRFMIMFIILAIPILAHYLDRLLPSVLRKMLSFGMIVLLCFTFWVNRGLFFSSPIDVRNYPVGAVNFLAHHNLLKIRMFNHYDWGGYLIWRGIPVFIDGRNMKKELMVEYYHSMFMGKLAGLEVRSIDMVLFPGSDSITGRPFGLFDSLMESDEWVLLYGDNNSMIFLKNKQEYVELIRSVSIPKSWAYNTIIVRSSQNLSANPDNALALAAMAEAYKRKGMPQTGRRYIASALSIMPYDEYVRQVAGEYQILKERFQE